MSPNPTPTGEADEADETAVLAVTGFTRNPDKFTRHVGPLVDLVSHLSVVSRMRYERLPGVTYRYVPRVGHKLVELLVQFVYAAWLARRDEYDLVVSFSMVPYGLFALAVGRLSGTPVHLGVMGSDIDVHAERWYGPLTVRLFRAFDVVSVPGEVYRGRLIQMGVDEGRAVVLVNPVDVDEYEPAPTETSTEYDYIWVGRFSAEKQPLAFVRALAALDEERSFEAVMLGDGPLEAEVDAALEAAGIADRVDRPGWVDDPVEYYQSSSTFVLTSSRDALPLTLVEAMACGLPCVAPRVGAIPEVVDQTRAGRVLADADGEALAAALAALSADADGHARLAANATSVRERYSYDGARRDWQTVVRTAGGGQA